MASTQDIYNAMLTATQSLNTFTQTFPRTGGYITPVNNLSSGAWVQVTPANSSRNCLTFHNPGTEIVYVAPTIQGSSQGAFSPSGQTYLGGTWMLVPGDSITFSGTCQQAWQATVAAGSSQPLTVFQQ